MQTVSQQTVTIPTKGLGFTKRGMAARRRGGLPPPRSGFNRQPSKPETGIHPQMLKQARRSGQLNLSNRSLTEVPDEIWRINIDVPEESRHIALDNTEDRWWEQEELTKLILASNALTAISPDIKQLPALTVLDIHDNRLSALPDEIGELSNLFRLNISHNSVKVIPNSICFLFNLKSLHVQHNELEELPADIGKLKSLEDLDISNNQLSSLPQEIGYLNGVMKLTFTNNKIKAIPHEVGCMTALRVLDATHNQIHSIPDDLGLLRNLEQLYLRHNRITHLPVLHSCVNLKELHLGNNGLMNLTEEHLHHLQSISVLDLRDNKISKIPDEVSVLQGLERLDLTNNDLTNLPYVLGTLPNLKSIVLDGNSMKGIRRDIVMRGTNELKKYLVSRMPEADVQTAALQQTSGASGIIGGGEGIDAHAVHSSKALEYSGKKATAVPSELWEVAQSSGVTLMNFSKNALAQWPEEMTVAASTLSEIHLGNNRIPSIPGSVGDFTRLLMLDVRNNHLMSLPYELGSCVHLRELMIAYNRFTEIPLVVYKLKKLENLIASSNKIQTVDSVAMKNLPMLATLDLQNNDISQVPPELGNCTQLRSLLLEGNAFRMPRPAILAKGTLAILEYLRGRIPQ